MNVKQLAATASLALYACTSLAQDADPIPLTLTPTLGGLATTFDRVVTGLFVDTFNFTPQSVNGTVAVGLSSGSANLNFFAALLNGQSFSFLPDSGGSTFSFQALVTSDMPLSLTVFGFSGEVDTLAAVTASYSGTVQVVPEPESYALLLAGLGVVAMAARRKRVVP